MTTALALDIRLPRAPRVTAAVVAAVLGAVVAGIVVLAGSRPRDLLLFVLAAVLTGAGCLSARMSIVAMVATFTFSALVRRLLPAAIPNMDPAAIAPFLVALPLAVRGLRTKKPVPVVALVVLATLSAALSFSNPLVGLAGWLNFCVPLLAAFGARAVPAGFAILARSTVLCGAIAATYGIMQYVVPFSWDVNWLEHANFVSVGSFGKANFRPFATLPAPGTAAVLTGVVILILIFRRDLFEGPSWARLVRPWALTSSILLLMLTQVRSVWVALTLALVLGLLARGRQSALRIAACVGMVLVVLAIAPQSQVVSNRAQTLTSLETDASFLARLQAFRGAGALASPFGTGLGSRSTASRVKSDNTIDNGYLVVLAETGVIGLGLLIWVLVSTASQARTAELPFLVYFGVNGLAALVSGLPGIALWALAGATRERTRAGAAALGGSGPEG